MVSSEASGSDANMPMSNEKLQKKSMELKSRSNEGKSSISKSPRMESDDNDIPSTAPPAPKKKAPLMERVVSSVALLGTMTLCYLMGHLYYSLLLIAFVFKCYFEIVNINRNQRKDSKNELISFIEICPPFIQFFYLLPKTFIRRILVENDSLINLKE